MPTPDDLPNLSLVELAQRVGQPGSQLSHWVEMEFARRQTVILQEAAAAQIQAAEATKETAKSTRDNARYMLYSVIVLTLSSVASFVLQLLTYLRPAQE